MRTRTTTVVGITVALFAQKALAQTAVVAPNPLGVWRGTSSCLVRPSACNDESVVYRITRSKSSDSVAIDGRRIANGQEVEMGVLTCHVATPGTQLTCTIPSGVWRFTIRGDSLVG